MAVFKNGLGFFLREGDVKLRDGWCVAEHVPPAAFGTLAIYARSEKETGRRRRLGAGRDRSSSTAATPRRGSGQAQGAAGGK